MAVRGLDCLRAIKPDWCINLHFKVPEDNAGVVQFVDLVESRVEAASEGRAGCVEAGLCDGVVGGVEVEVDDVAYGSIELIGTEE